MSHSFLISHMGVGYGRQVYGLVWWIWYGLYACVKMLYYVVCATIALSWLATVRFIVFALDLCVAYLKPHVGVFGAFFILFGFVILLYC